MNIVMPISEGKEVAWWAKGTGYKRSHRALPVVETASVTEDSSNLGSLAASGRRFKIPQ